MIDELLPESVSAAEVFGAPPAAALLPEEEPLVAHAVAKRTREFAAGRWCARRAMAGLGSPPVPILPGPRGEPRWPSGLVGAITHCEGYAAAAVARSAEVLALGVDAEPAKPLPDGVLEAVALPGERAALPQSLYGAPPLPWDRLLFSAKESVYKAWFPMTRRPLEFEDAWLTFDPDDGTFTARLLVPGWRLGDSVLTGFQGRWAVRAGLVMTAVAVPAGQGERPDPAPEVGAATGATR
ncbi:4'-phosphopantetheinyl transferase family protein [Streptomyces angustmyceticus]|uniref:4'-phosphopantetheinyl transferase family protein n=1 Tax=Streptomyces angustmyceticus TaxID=285578 RepID=UPI0021AFAF57|nr:4'-phosphopantetheinyl transferase superfamily protein [Streptomyces angustmyceticus]